MVWPDASRMTAFDSVSASYTAAAEAVGGLLFPAGDAWVRAWEKDATLPLYSNDNFHPSTLGSYLAALTIYDMVKAVDRAVAMQDRFLRQFLRLFPVRSAV